MKQIDSLTGILFVRIDVLAGHSVHGMEGTAKEIEVIIGRVGEKLIMEVELKR